MKIYTVTGCIAAGKTTFADRLSKTIGCKLLTEDCDNNPFIARYYDDMKEWAFKMQMWYLNSRISQLMKSTRELCIVQDQMIQAFGFIFPSLQKKSDILSEAEYYAILNTLDKFYEQDVILSGTMETVFYLRVKPEDVDILVMRIKDHRGRDFEQSIEKDYLVKLIAEYEGWFLNALKSTTKKVVVLDAFDPIQANIHRAMSSMS